MSIEKSNKKIESKPKSENKIERVDIKKHVINPNIKMKFFDEFGFEEDGQDHSNLVV